MLRASTRHHAMRLSMFPTPKFAYFKHYATAASCKPHLRSAYCQLFETAAGCPTGVFGGAPAPIPGGNFTRFMLAGFLTFRAWQELGAQTLEAYPDLQFRLSSRSPLLPKRAGKAAVAPRIAVIKQLRRALEIGTTSLPATLDQADAEILALSVAIAVERNSLAALEHPAEGRFLITF